MIDKLFKKNATQHKLLVNFKKQLEENTKFISIVNKTNKKLLIFNRLLETRAPSIISRTSVIYLWKLD